MAILAILVLLVIGRFRFGSVGAVAEFFVGERILIDSGSKDFGSLRLGDERLVPFLITNASGRRLTVLGSSSTCPCAVSSGLPITIPSWCRQRIAVRVTRAAKPGPFDQEIRFFLDDPLVRVLRVRITGSVDGSTTSKSSLVPVAEAGP